jgi:hypothetical protein
MTTKQIEQKIHDLTLAFFATRKEVNKVIVGDEKLPTSTIMFYMRTSDKTFTTTLYGKQFRDKKLSVLLDQCESYIIEVYKAVNKLSPRSVVTLQRIIESGKNKKKKTFHLPIKTQQKTAKSKIKK